METQKPEDKPFQAENKKPERNPIPGLVIFIFLLTGIIFLIVVNYQRFDGNNLIRKTKEIVHHPDAIYEKCRESMSSISTALEMYSSDNGGKYPDSLSKLTPNYLITLPACPAANKDTYSNTYHVNKKANFFYFSCGGNNHSNIGLLPNFPRVNLTTYLTVRSGDFDDDIRLYKYNEIMEALARDPTYAKRKGSAVRTPLHYAAKYNFNEIIIPLREEGADINAVDEYWQTPLHIAVYYDHYETAELLLNRGATANIRDMTGKTPMDLAVENENNDIVDLLKDARFTKNYAPENHKKNLDICRINLHNIYDALDSYYGDHGESYPDSLSQLVPKYLKAIPTCPAAGKDTYSATYHLSRKAKFFDISCGGNNHSNTGLLPNFPRINFTTYITVRNGDFDDDVRLYKYNEIMEALARDPTYAKRKGSAERTPLHCTAVYNFNEIIIPLLEKGADINAVDEYWQTPLHIAVYYDHYETVKLLLKKGAGKDIKDKKGMTPLAVAVDNGRTDIVELLKANPKK